MKRTETRQEQTVREIVAEMKCDLCGKPTPKDPRREGVFLDSWALGYDYAETTVECRTGESYPEGSFTETLVFDICPDCFKDKLIPWLASQGAQPRKEDRDF